MFYIDGVQDDSIAVSVPSNGSAVIQNVSMDCHDGHTFSIVSGVVPGAVVDFKHASDVSWTDIENNAYDLSPFASEAQPVAFQIRFDPESVTLQEVRFRKGPLLADTTPPSVPTGLMATVISDTQIDLEWDASTGDPTGYEYRIDAGSAVDNGNVLTESVTGLTPETEYDFQVRAYDAAGNRSSYSAAVSATTDAAPFVFTDPDAEAFSDEIGTLNDTQNEALDQLVLDLKADSLWAKMIALYPFVGGNATAHSYNLKDVNTFQITWNGTVTHNANGVAGDASTGYGDTGYNPTSDSMNAQDNHFSVYSRTSSTVGAKMELGGETAAGNRIYLGAGFFDSAYHLNGVGASEISVANANAQGFYIGTRRGSADAELYKNGSSIGTDTDSNASATLSTHNIYLCGSNNAGSLVLASDKNIAFASIGTGLTDTDAANFYTTVQAFQAALSRSV